MSQGLTSDMAFLDVACGGLRLGQFLTPALNTGKYFGIEGEEGLVMAGIENQMLFDVIRAKEPRFAFNYTFDLRFCSGYDFGIAQSLFTHLNLHDISKCFASRGTVANPQSQFFFTFHEGNEVRNRHTVSHANKKGAYPFEALKEVADAANFDSACIGD